MTLPLTLQERYALGREQRKHMRRADHAGWTPKLRTESPLKLLQSAFRGRVSALLPVKNQRMAVSPFTYFRGAAPVMAYDLSLSLNTGIHTQLCGDAHALNLGAFEGPGGTILFDLNDFDESIAGPFEWDVKRMATSMILAGWDAGAGQSHCREASAVFLDSYRRSIVQFSNMPVLELARYQVHRLDDMATMSQLFALAQRSTAIHNLENLTEPASSSSPTGKHPSGKLERDKKSAKSNAPPPHPTGSSRVFKSNPPLLTRLHGAKAQRVVDSLATYSQSLHPERRHFLAQYRPIDVAFKVVGTGSVGLRAYCIYMEGNGPRDPLFLQIKEEVASVYTHYLGNVAGEPYHQGQRVVEGERAMQLQSDPFLGWTTIDGRDFLVRQLNDHKASIDLTQLKSADLLEYATVCGEILARGHARAGDPAMLAGYIGTSDRFDRAIGRFARAYANQTEKDWQQFVRSTGAKKKPAPPSKSSRKTAPKSKSKS